MPAMSPQEYFEKIKTLRDPEKIKAVCEELTKDLVNETDKPKTRANKLTPYNKVINIIPNEELIEDENAYIQTRADGSYWKRHLHFKFTGIATTNWNGQGGINNKTIVIDRLENQKPVDAIKYLEITSRLLLSENPHELAVGLIAASGRRPIEILTRGSFALAQKLPDYLKPGYFVQFKGQAKKREYDVPEDERTEYRIGVLVPAKFFLEAFKRFRKMPETQELLDFAKTEAAKGTDPEEINKSINNRRGNSLRRVVIAEFGAFISKRHGEDELNSKALRAVYVRLITDRDCPKNINPLLWASRAVGHFVDTTKVSDRDLSHLVTTLGYSDYYADTEIPFMEAPAKPKPKVEKMMQVRVSTEDYEAIKHLQAEWKLLNQQTVVKQLLEMAIRFKDYEKDMNEAHNKITHLIDENTTLQNTIKELETMQPVSLENLDQIVEEKLNIVLPGFLEQFADKITAQISAQITAQITAQIASARVTTDTPGTTATPDTTETLTTNLANTTAATTDTTTQHIEVKQPKAKAEKPARDLEGLSWTDLKALRGQDAVNEKIQRAFNEITKYNDYKATEDTQRWAITNQALRQVSGCNGQAVADWMVHHAESISTHNNKHGLGQYHNKRHKQAITDLIKMEPEESNQG
jgi:hypothetical protein